jgi:hypothetical protein
VLQQLQRAQLQELPLQVRALQEPQQQALLLWAWPQS